MIELQVQCYAGYRGNERPVRFCCGGNWLEVAEVQDQWYSPESRYFRVLAGDGAIYVLQHDEGKDCWSLSAFRAESFRGRAHDARKSSPF